MSDLNVNKIKLTPDSLATKEELSADLALKRSPSAASSLASGATVTTANASSPLPILSKISSTDSGVSTSRKRVNKRSSQKPKKKRKNLCFFKDCDNLSLKLIGDCKFCNGSFCSKHRIMENHDCNRLNDCKEIMHKKNADKLNKEQTLIPKLRI
ncbi:hypothetical protein KAFR_0C06140 [Kazachstania africana CBS 2517]|uniref:AN1-type domain-containing protein n=1 Tax=Kazachstania africana (strain ATCC 22294 / BCRC 22015 / CBS 2517 / CECT 1963 / NBRC 1671 / NRRL Y-8276) TaxID=1071382 RepID=H2ATA6_KAZAF|nr:hypothetical protein KAFR_0C06140 [Kazachstania africana CBS 2517]CCF57606.1 hypothetical protein KAFR_0C06140 [Kazachstania africana CBS 2517]